jgi:glutamine synthetase type III
MTAEIARTIVLPAAVRYLDDLLDAYHNYRELGGDIERTAGSSAREVNDTLNELVEALDTSTRRTPSSAATTCTPRRTTCATT